MVKTDPDEGFVRLGDRSRSFSGVEAVGGLGYAIFNENRFPVMTNERFHDVMRCGLRTWREAPSIELSWRRNGEEWCKFERESAFRFASFVLAFRFPVFFAARTTAQRAAPTQDGRETATTEIATDSIIRRRGATATPLRSPHRRARSVRKVCVIVVR